MNRQPPHPDPPEDADERYRQASALDPSRPSEATRNSVLGHAAQLAAERARHVRMRARRWRPALFGALAAAALAGLLVAPRYFLPGTPIPPHAAAPPVAATSAAVRSSPAAAETAPAAPAEVGPASPLAAPEEPARRAGRHAERDVRADYLAAREAATARSAPPPEKPASPRERGASGAQELNSFIGGMAPGRQPKVSDGSAEADAGEALRRAAESGNVAALRRLLAGQTGSQAYSSELRTPPRPVDINARDAEGRTALLRATLHNQQETVLALLADGADPNIADARGVTPLQAARAGGYGAVAETLQRYGAR